MVAVNKVVKASLENIHKYLPRFKHIFKHKHRVLGQALGQDTKSKKSTRLVAILKLQVRITKYLMRTCGVRRCICVPNMKFLFLESVARTGAHRHRCQQRCQRRRRTKHDCIRLFGSSVWKNRIWRQWRIQDFPQGASTRWGDADRHRHFSAEMHVKTKELGPGGGAPARPLDLPMEDNDHKIFSRLSLWS